MQVVVWPIIDPRTADLPARLMTLGATASATTLAVALASCAIASGEVAASVRVAAAAVNAAAASALTLAVASNPAAFRVNSPRLEKNSVMLLLKRSTTNTTMAGQITTPINLTNASVSLMKVSLDIVCQ